MGGLQNSEALLSTPWLRRSVGNSDVVHYFVHLSDLESIYSRSPYPKIAHHNEQLSAQIALCTVQVKVQSLVNEMTLCHEEKG